MMELVVLALIIAVINLYSKVTSLKKRLTLVESSDKKDLPDMLASEQSARGLGAPATEKSTEHVTDLAVNFSHTEKIADETSSVAASEQSARWQDFDLGAWLSQDWPLKLGASLLLIAVGWFVTYAFMNDWIGPAGRIMLGLITGAGLIGFAEWWQRRSSAQSTILYGLGTATVLVTILAARFVFEMFSPGVVLFMAVSLSALVAASAYRHNLASRGVIGLIAALVAPLLTASETNSYLGLLGYLAAVSIGYTALIWLKGWRPLLACLLAGVLLYLLPIIAVSGSQEDLRSVALQFSAFFTLLFFSANLATLLRTRTADIWHLVSGAALGFFGLFWITYLLPDHWESLVVAGLALLFIAASTAAYRVTGNRQPVLVYAAIAVLLLGSAISLELSGPSLVVALSLFVVIINLVGGYLLTSRKESIKLAWLFVIPGMLSLESLEVYQWYKSIPMDDFAVISILAMSLFLVATVYRQWLFAGLKDDIRPSLAPLDIAGLGYCLALIWLVNSALFTDSVANSFSLILWTIISIGLYVAGKVQFGKTMKLTGIVVLTLVILRLLFVEIWDMPLAGRIVTFALIGVMLMATALVEKGLGAQKQEQS